MNTTDKPPIATAPPPASGADGWRVVTGIMAIFFVLVSLIYLLLLSEIESQQIEDCETGPHYIAAEVGPTYEGERLYLAADRDCPGISFIFYTPAIWALAVAACFGLATTAPIGGKRRAPVIAGICLLLVLILFAWAISSPITVALSLGVTAIFFAVGRVSGRRPADGPERVAKRRRRGGGAT